MKKVYVLLDDSDIDWCVSTVGKHDIILTDIPVGNKFSNVYQPKIENEQKVADSVYFWFERQCSVRSVSIGYVNNFYECSIRPLLGFLDAATKIIDNERGNVRFFLGKKPIFLHKTSTYFLAEYESMGVKLYDRRSTFIPYLVKMLDSKDVKYTFESYSYNSQAYFLGPIRRGAVFLFRLYNAIKASRKNIDTKETINKKYDCCFTLRTVGQARAILGYLKSTRKKVLVLVSSSTLGDDAYSFLKDTVNNNNVEIIICQYPSLKSVIASYFSSLFRKRSKYRIELGEYSIELTSAIREVLIMQIELEAYQKQITNMLGGYQFSSNANFYSLEFTSPHAYIDAETAKTFDLTPIQIQPCDRAFRPLPYPIFSNLLCTKSQDLARAYIKCWPEFQSKIKYVGSFCVSNINQGFYLKNDESSKVKVCIFSGAHESVNKSLVNFIQKNFYKSNFDFYLKKHPRDHTDYGQFNVIKGVIESDSKIYHSIGSMDFAITYPSAVINEIILMKLPFVIFIPFHNDYILADKELETGLNTFPRAYSDVELKAYIENHVELTIKSLQEIEKYIALSGMIYDPVVIEDTLNKIKFED